MFYLVDKTEDLCPEDSLSESSEKLSEEVREEAGQSWVFVTKASTSKDYCYLKKIMRHRLDYWG